MREVPGIEVLPEKIQGIVKKICEKAEKTIADHKEVEPVLFFFTADAESPTGFGAAVGLLPIGALINSGPGKQIILQIMEEAVEENNVDVVVMVTEAWLAQIPVDEITKEEVVQLRVSERPDKEEVVLFNIMTKTDQYVASAKIIREPSPTLEKIEVISVNDKDSEMEGNLVSERKPPSIH